ncbi:MAG: hypothetical protein AAF515_07965 [Pseudomonadota bacterium]
MNAPPRGASDVIGIAPMAGRGSRLGADSSKEVVPIANLGMPAERVLGSYAFAHMARAGIQRCQVIVDPIKTDIPSTFGTSVAGVRLDYTWIENSPSPVASLDAAYAALSGRVCALSFPDILYRPCRGYEQLLEQLLGGDADVVLGLFPALAPEHCDMVRLGDDGAVDEIRIKSATGAELTHTWMLAVWRPRFTDFLHDFATELGDGRGLGREAFIGDVVLAAQAAGLDVRGRIVSPEPALDAGTPAALARAREQSWE